MSGISRIAQKQERVQMGGGGTPGREVWFRDGDQAFLSPVSTGEDGDDKFDEIYMFTYKVNDRWTNKLSDESVDTSDVPENIRPSHKFAFWAYVHEILHPERRNEDWMEISGPSGRKLFKEEVNDFKVIALTFGRSNYIWNQLLDIYNDWGALNKGVMRIKRTGTGMYDTSYTLAATARDVDMPGEKEGEVDGLPTIKEYFKERYGDSSSIGSLPVIRGSEIPDLVNVNNNKDNLFS